MQYSLKIKKKERMLRKLFSPRSHKSLFIPLNSVLYAFIFPVLFWKQIRQWILRESKQTNKQTPNCIQRSWLDWSGLVQLWFVPVGKTCVANIKKKEKRWSIESQSVSCCQKREKKSLSNLFWHWSLRVFQLLYTLLLSYAIRPHISWILHVIGSIPEPTRT